MSTPEVDVMTALDSPAVDGATYPLSVPTKHEGPVLLDARPVIRYALYCSECGKRHEDEYGPTTWPADVLGNLGAYCWYDGWAPNVDGRALVCGSCYEAAWCSGCHDVIHAWETAYHLDNDSAHLSSECLEAAGVAAGDIDKLVPLMPGPVR